MGYFDGLTDASFKTDAEGNSLFYPWGVMGAGYILPSEYKKNSIRTYIKRMYMIVLPAIILIQIVFGFLPNLILLAVYMIWYYLAVKKMTSDLTKSTVKLKTSEAYTNSAKSHNLPTLIFLSICSLVFVVMGALLIASGTGGFIGYFTVLFFGLCTVAIGYMAKIKIQSKKSVKNLD